MLRRTPARAGSPGRPVRASARWGEARATVTVELPASQRGGVGGGREPPRRAGGRRRPRADGEVERLLVRVAVDRDVVAADDRALGQWRDLHPAAGRPVTPGADAA